MQVWVPNPDKEGTVAFLQGDTTSSSSVDAAVAHVVEHWGKLDIWINNAAIGVGGDLLHTTEESWDRVLAVNAKGYWLGARAAVRQMLSQPIDPETELRGKIINISSQHGMVCWCVMPSPTSSPYYRDVLPSALCLLVRPVFAVLVNCKFT